VRRKPDEPLLMRLGRSLFECFENDPTEVELVFVEFCPIDDRVVRRAAELLGPQAVADHILDVDEAIPGKRVFKEMAAAVTVLRIVSFAAIPVARKL
jgi:hypothetical protein